MYPVQSSEPFLSGILNKYPLDVKSASSQWCNWKHFCLPRDIGLEVFVITPREEGVEKTDIMVYLVEVKDAGKNPTIHRTASIIISQSINHAEVEKLF